jgi:diaminohydroxyphosphoribosylaminopyrimidine deaminase / 5-amino-6-(5-phosphoribosylamino)uracil reductase
MGGRRVDERDRQHLGRAIRLAERGHGLASPNPPVGAVVAAADGRVLGEGWHEGPGTPHAEVAALRAAGAEARGATLYSSLEPCDHSGRTGPCTAAILAAGVARVVAGARDPNPLVDGRGLQRLRSAGVVIETPRRSDPGEAELIDAAERLVAGFARHVRTGLPLVVLKMAATMDGKVASRDGTSRWITGEAARTAVHRMRASADAVMVGAGTALADDPSLTVRLEGYRGRQPLRVVVDGAGRVRAGGKLFDGAAPTLVATSDGVPPDRARAWADAGAEVWRPEEPSGELVTLVPLAPLVEHLGKRDVQTLLIEGGPTLAWSALSEGVVDRLVVFLAPKLLGGRAAPGIVGGEGFAPVDAAIGLEIRRIERVGEDLMVEADVHRDR